MSNSTVAELTDTSSGHTIGTLSTTDEDAGDTFTYTVEGGADQGVFSINGTDLVLTNGILDFETKPSYEVIVRTTDAGSLFFEQTLTITVTNANEPPTAINISNSAIDELIDTTSGYSIGVLAGIDPDAGDTLSYSVVGGADQANFIIGGAGSDELIISDGILDYETKSSYEVIVRVTDSGNFTFDQIFTITINDVNDPPIASDDEYTINEDTQNNNFAVLINDTDQDGDTLTVFAVGTPDQGGTVNISGTNDSVIYAPAVDFFGTETFTYTADDSNGTSTATVTITVTPEPDLPNANDLSFSTTINTDIYPYLSGSDPDGDIITYFLLTTGSLGRATIIQGDGLFNYHPNNGVTGDDTFTYFAWDGTLDENGTIVGSSPATVTISIYEENFAPVAYDGLLDVVMDTFAGATLAMTDANPGGSHIFSIVTNGSLGTAFIDDNATGAYTYTPNPGVTGTDSFTYKVNDGIADSNEATITVSIIDSADLMVIKRISTTQTEESNANSYYPALSADGRYVTFNSFADNLVSGTSGGQVYLYDRVNDSIELVSVSSFNEDGNNTSDFSSVNSDGQYVVFSSYAANLTVGDDNNRRDIFIRDRSNGLTEVISISDLGELGNNTSNYPAISNDGQYIVFESTADNLVLNDTNSARDVFVFVRDGLNSTIERVSVSSSGAEGSLDSGKASISQDGRYVAFESMSNLASGALDNSIFVRDRLNDGTTELISPASSNPSISGDGRYVVFESFNSNLVADDTNGVSDVFVYDRQTGTTVRISLSSAGTEGDAGSYLYGQKSNQNSMSADGQYIIFESDATNLVAGDTNAAKDIFVHKRISQSTGVTQRISRSTFGVEGDSQSWWPSISADGQVKAFSSEASNLVGNDTNNRWDVFIVHPFNN